MDSVLGDDPTLPLDFSYRPGMFMSTTSENGEATTPACNHDVVNEYVQNTDLLSAPSGGHFMSGRISPSNNRNIKDYGTQISELKKENFSLKLRIFYMEERMMEQFSEDQDQLWKSNIELKVECDSLRKELGEKHDLLVKASNAVACIEAGNPEEARKIKVEAEREVAQMRELMNEKLANAKKDVESARHDSEQSLEQAVKLKKELLDVQEENKELTDALLMANEELEKAKKRSNDIESSATDAINNGGDAWNNELVILRQKVKELGEELDEKNRTIAQLQNSLSTKQTLIELLNGEKELPPAEQVQPYLNEIDALKEKLQKSEMSYEKSRKNYQDLLILQDEYQDHITEQQQRLDEFELATKQVSEELDKREIEVKDLKEALQDSEKTIQELMMKLGQSGGKQQDLDKTRKELNNRDRAITSLTQMVTSKDEEIVRLNSDVDKLNLEIESLKFDISFKESKAEEMLKELKRFEASKKIESSPSKDLLIQQLRNQLKESNTALQEALDEKSRFEDEHDKYVRDCNQKAKEQNRQTERLKSQVSDLEETLSSLENDTKEKDFQFQELTSKNKKLSKELQESMEENNRLEEVHDKCVREFNQQTKEDGRQIERLKSQVTDYEESVLSLDSKLKEKDWQLQELANKHKKLLKDFQDKEEERVRAVLERDELLAQCEEEKNRFSTLANKMLRRSGSDLSSKSSSNESETLSHISKLEEELTEKNKALKEATIARDKALQEQSAACQELQKELNSRDREIEGDEREIGLKEVEIRELKDLLRDSEDKLLDYENKMRLEVDKLVRQNSDLREKLRNSENELQSLKSKQGSLRSYTSDDNSVRSSVDPKSFQRKHSQELTEEIKELRRELAIKDEEIEKIRRIRLSIDKADPDDVFSSTKMNRNVTFGESQTEKNDFDFGSISGDNDNDVTITQNDSKVPQFHRLRQVYSQTRHDNLTADSTFGLPFDETSYMTMPYGRRSIDAIDVCDGPSITVSKLKDLLAETRKQLSSAEREISALKLVSCEYMEQIQSLEKKLEAKSEEYKNILQKYNESNQQKMVQESEVLGLLARIRNEKRARAESDVAMTDSAADSDNALHSARTRRKSGDQSNGISALSKKELCEEINNLKKKLDNAEKVNELLERQIEDFVEEETKKSSSFVNNQLVADLTAEVQKLKTELKSKEKENEDISPPRLVALPSKLPLPKNYKGLGKAQNPLRPELERARLLNRKLNEQLAATEQTVRVQAEKLNKCRIAFKEAGITSPPISPLRAARSLSDLRTTSPDLPSSADKKDKLEKGRQSAPADTKDVETQTVKADSVAASVSPKSEQKFNSLIQSQAKELSILRKQLKKSKDTCKHLQTEMDIVSRYLKAFLSTSESVPDPSMISGIEDEIERSKKLVSKLRKGLSDNVEDLGHSGEETDSSFPATPLPLITFESKQLEKIKKEVIEKNDEIRQLNIILKQLQENIKALKAERNRLSVDLRYPIEKWQSTPELHPFHQSALNFSATPITVATKKKPSSVGSPHRRSNDIGLLTPASSHLSLHSLSGEETKINRSDFTRLKVDGVDDGFAQLPFSGKQQRLSWPIEHDRMKGNQAQRRSVPMYQRTIAVTEYLPPNVKSDKGRSYSAASGTDEASSHHLRFLPTSDPFRCSASYGGKWSHPNVTPPKSDDVIRHILKNKPSPIETSRMEIGDSSCDELRGEKKHKLVREVDRLRRRLTDSKKINRSLKEELDLANKSLLHARDSLQPGYKHSSYHDAELLAEHLNEIRTLRQRLEQSIETNDKLREKLEERLRDTSHDSKEHLSTNIFLEADLSPTSNPSEIHQLEKSIQHLERENDKLKKRLKAEEKAHVTYEDAVREMKALQNHVKDKSGKIDRLTEHVRQLQHELEQQTSLSDQLGKELHSRDKDLSEMKQKLEEVETEKTKLEKDNHVASESSNKFWNDLQSSRVQLEECRQLIDSLKCELSLYEEIQRKEKSNASRSSLPHADLLELLQEIRSLRSQLERSIETNAALRQQLEEQLKNPTSRDEGSLTTINIHHLSPRSNKNQSSPLKRSPLSARRKLKLESFTENNNVIMTPPASASSGAEERDFDFTLSHQHKAPSLSENEMQQTHKKEFKQYASDQEKDKKPFYSRGGPYTLCKANDFFQLQQALAKSGLIARTADNKVAEALKAVVQPVSREGRIFKDVSKSTNSLCHLLDQSDQLLRLFWPAILPFSHQLGDENWGRSYSSSGVATGGHSSSAATPTLLKKQNSDTEYSIASETDGLRREVGRLRRRLSTQDRLLQTTVERLHNTNKLKEGIEHAIVKQLTRTHDVLRKARGNLEAKAQDAVYRPHNAT